MRGADDERNDKFGKRRSTQEEKSPSEKLSTQINELNRAERFGEDVGKLFGRCDGSDVHDAGLEMLSKPVIFDGNAFGSWRHLGWIGGCERKACLVILKNGGFDDRVTILFEVKRRGDLIQDDAEREQDAESLR